MERTIRISSPKYKPTSKMSALYAVAHSGINPHIDETQRDRFAHWWMHSNVRGLANAAIAFRQKIGKPIDSQTAESLIAANYACAL